MFVVGQNVMVSVTKGGPGIDWNETHLVEGVVLNAEYSETMSNVYTIKTVDNVVRSCFEGLVQPFFFTRNYGK